LDITTTLNYNNQYLDMDTIKDEIAAAVKYVFTAQCHVENVANQTTRDAMSDQPATGNFLVGEVKAPDDE
jgi:hypothetical protein